jgi:hypothetical protein
LQLKKSLEEINDKRKSLFILNIEDSNCYGLTGPEGEAEDIEKPNFFNLCKATFYTSETPQSTRGGSFGVGKSILWNCSKISTVIFSSLVDKNEKEKTQGGLRVFGRTSLPSHNFGDEHFRGPGYFGSPVEVKDKKNQTLQMAHSVWNNHKLAKDLLAGEKAFQEAKLSIVSDSITILENLNSALVDSGIVNAKKGFQIAKTLGIAQATISTIEATQNAFKTAQASPITTVFPAYPFIQAGVAASAGIARIASIRAQKFNGGSTPPTPSPNGGGGGGGTSAPAVDLSFLNVNGNKAQPIQTYVLATNVSSAQEAEQKIKDQSKIIK